MDEFDECSGAIRGSERHNRIGPFNSIRALESKFLLAVGGDDQLVIPGRSIKHPHPLPHAKFLGDCRVAARDRIRDDPCDQVEWGIVDAKPPYKLIDVADMLLMWLRHENGLKEPTPIVNLAYVTNFFKSSHGFTHDQNCLGAIHDLFYRDGVGIAGINDALVVSNRYENTTIIKDRPVFDNQRIDLLL